MSSRGKCPFIARRGRIPEQFVGEDSNRIIDEFDELLRCDGWELPHIVGIGAVPGAGLTALISELAGLAEIAGFVVPPIVPPTNQSERAAIRALVENLVTDEYGIVDDPDKLIDSVAAAQSAMELSDAIVSAFSMKAWRDWSWNQSVLICLDRRDVDDGVSLDAALCFAHRISGSFPSSRVVIVAGGDTSRLVARLSDDEEGISSNCFEQSFYLLRCPTSEEVADWYASELAIAGIDGAYDEDGDISLPVMSMAEAACSELGGSLLTCQSLGASVWRSGKRAGRVTARDVDEAVSREREREGETST